MKRRVRAAVIVALMLPALVGGVSAQTRAAPAALEPAFLRWSTGPVRLDGVLDDPAWLAADSLSDFTQLDPDEGQPATERTVVRLLGTAEGSTSGWRRTTACLGE